MLNKTKIHLLIFFSISGCASVAGYKLTVETWMGHTSDDLIASWGPPSNSTFLSDGGRLFQYIKSRQISSGGYSYSVPRTVDTNVNVIGSNGWATGNATTTVYDNVNVPVSYEQRTCITNYRSNSNNIITSVTFEGNDCLAHAPSVTTTSTSNTTSENKEGINLGLGNLWK